VALRRERSRAAVAGELGVSEREARPGPRHRRAGGSLLLRLARRVTDTVRLHAAFAPKETPVPVPVPLMVQVPTWAGAGAAPAASAATIAQRIIRAMEAPS